MTAELIVPEPSNSERTEWPQATAEYVAALEVSCAQAEAVKGELVGALHQLIDDTRDMLFGPRGVAECSEEDFYAGARAALTRAGGGISDSAQSQPVSGSVPLSVGDAGGSGAIQVPDPDMTASELEVLRILNGEDVPGWVAGAAMWACCAWLKGRGYAEGTYRITQKGRDYLAAMASSETPPLNPNGEAVSVSASAQAEPNPNPKQDGGGER